jgi:predicted homoserine dehydrogenase-like protein
MPVSAGNPLPYYMAVNRTLTRAVRKGEPITADCVAAPGSSVLWGLRSEQDQSFFG